MRVPKGPDVRIVCCTFKNQRASAMILNSTIGGIWFSTQRLLRNCFGSFELTTTFQKGHASKGRFKTRKSRDGANTTLTTNFFTKEKKICMLRTTETTILFFDSQPNDRNVMRTQHRQLLFASQLKHSTYHLHSTTSTTCSQVENGNFNVTVYK